MNIGALLTSHLTINCEAQIELTDSPATNKSGALVKRQKSLHFPQDGRPQRSPSLAITLLAAVIAGLASCSSCSSILDKQREARPLVLRDVPAQRLAYRFEPDVAAPEEATGEANNKIEAIQIDFDSRRQNDALLKTVRSPDGQRALALYGTEEESSQAFRIDLYSSDGTFLRNLTPPDLACVFPEAVSWSPDGSKIAFALTRSLRPRRTRRRASSRARKRSGRSAGWS